MYTKNALGNLKNRYIAVLKKCSLINVFGSLALATLLAAPSLASANALTTTTDPVLNNSGTLSGDIEFSYFVGMMGYNAGTNQINYVLTNYADGIISFTTDQTAYAMLAESRNADGNYTLLNKGTINITSNASSAFGMIAYLENGSGNHNLTNDASITVKAHYTAYGMYVYVDSNGNHTLTNSGTITATSTDAGAYGMYVYADNNGNHNLTNNGTITAASTNDTAYGMRASSNNGSHSLTNSGTITATSTDNTAFGMLGSGDGNHSLTNKGTIIATSTDKTAFGMRGSGNGNHSLTNKGTITATSSDGYAFGMHVNGTNTASGVHLINNTGIITAKSANGKAFEVYGLNDYSIGTYATTLRDWTNKDAVFGTDSADVNFADSTLILRPGTIAQGFEYGKKYNVTDMIIDPTIGGSGGASPAAITGKIQNALAEVPFLLANLDNTDSTKPKVSLHTNVNEDTVSPTQLAKLSVGNVQNKITRMANRKINKMIERRMARNLRQVSEKAYEQGVILAGHHIPYAPTYQENKWAIYLDAYAAYAGNSEYDFGTHTKGMTLGAERAIGDKLNVGFAMDFSDSTTDGQDGLVADSTDITFAANADYFINPNWYVSGTMALSFGESNMDYRISPLLYAKDNYDSQAFYMAVNTGYVYEINENNIIVPEFGLSYLYSHSDDINVDFAVSDVYDMHIANDSFSALYANLMVTWQGQYDIALGTLRPSAGLGIRQNLTGSDFDSNVQALGSSFDTVVTEDDTTFLTNLGLEWQNGNFSMGVSYSGGYGSEQTSHSGNIKFRYEF